MVLKAIAQHEPRLAVRCFFQSELEGVDYGTRVLENGGARGGGAGGGGG